MIGALLALGNLIAKKHSNNCDEDIICNRTYYYGPQARTNGDPIDRFVGARPGPKASHGIVVADDDGDVGNERW